MTPVMTWFQEIHNPDVGVSILIEIHQFHVQVGSFLQNDILVIAEKLWSFCVGERERGGGTFKV